MSYSSLCFSQHPTSFLVPCQCSVKVRYKAFILKRDLCSLYNLQMKWWLTFRSLKNSGTGTIHFKRIPSLSTIGTTSPVPKLTAGGLSLCVVYISYTFYKLLSSTPTRVALCPFLTHLNFHMGCFVILSTSVWDKLTSPMMLLREFHGLWVYDDFMKNSAFSVKFVKAQKIYPIWSIILDFNIYHSPHHPS